MTCSRCHQDKRGVCILCRDGELIDVCMDCHTPAELAKYASVENPEPDYNEDVAIFKKRNALREFQEGEEFAEMEPMGPVPKVRLPWDAPQPLFQPAK